MPKLKKKYHITYDSWEGYYIIHTENGEVRFYKDEQGLPYIDLSNSNDQAATLLIQTCEKTMRRTQRKKSYKPRKQDVVRV